MTSMSNQCGEYPEHCMHDTGEEVEKVDKASSCWKPKTYEVQKCCRCSYTRMTSPKDAEVFTVEEVEPGLFQSVFPTALAEWSKLHSTREDAYDYIREIRYQFDGKEEIV